MNPFFVVVAVLGFSAIGIAKPALPEWTRPVVDEAGFLNSDDHARIEKKLIALKSISQVQMAIYLPASLQGYAIEDFSIAAAEKWKIGNKKEDRGLILVVAPRERQMRLEVGYGLEGSIPDVLARRILDDEVAPYLRQGRMADALEVAIEAVAERLGVTLGEAPVQRVRSRAPARTFWKVLWLLLIFLFIVRLLFRPSRWMGYRRGSWGGGSWPMGGGGFGRSGGGGFGGWSGGGGFGGGGASSRW